MKNIVIIALIIIAFGVTALCIERIQLKKAQKDAQTILDYYLEKITLDQEEINRLDVNKDGELDLFDAVKIIRGN